jgi:malonyl-CoA/methylmalonyl-CoA synthetase
VTGKRAPHLAPHKRPGTVRFLDELPRNDLGKVQKKRLAAPDRT